MIYLDNAATSHPKPESVIEAVVGYMKDVGASPGRSSHGAARRADEIVFNARNALAKLFGVGQSERIIFTSNATEALNLAIKGTLAPGSHAITTSLEHNSMLRPLRTLENRGVELTIIKDEDGSIDPEDIRRAIRPNTALIATVFAGNVTGTILPVRQIGEIAAEHGVPYLVDAAQAAGSIPIDLAGMPIDMLAFTGHKALLGPMGTGGLYMGDNINVEPLKEGGTGSESPNPFQPDALPDRFEAGTLNGPGIAGLGAAVQYIMETGQLSIRERELALAERLEQGLDEIEGVQIHSSRKRAARIAITSISIEGIESQQAAFSLDERFGICVRGGLHCAPDAHRSMGTFPDGTVRFAPGPFTTPEEIDQTIEAVQEVADNRRASRQGVGSGSRGANTI
jgi:cysteine desulfurase family protein